MFEQISLFYFFVLTFAERKDFCQTGIRRDQTHYIHCARKQLKEIPRFSSSRQTLYDELVLNDNQIERIESNSFVGLRVKRLNLLGNRLRWISSDAFVELENYLEDLSIEFDSNLIREIPSTIGRNLKNLRRVKFVDLQLTKLNETILNGFSQLEQLTISRSKISEIHSETFRSFSQLRHLNLEENFLNESIWRNLTEHLSQIEILILSQNRFQTIRHDDLRKFKSLKILDLSSNALQQIDATSLPSSLEKVFLQNNELNSLQLTFLFDLKRLEEFNVDFNRLTFLPEKIFQSNERLKSLSMQGNDFSSLTNDSFFSLKNLRYLNLARNRLQLNSIDEPFRHLITLKTLNLDRNFLSNLTSKVFRTVRSTLEDLSMQNCQLKSIEKLFVGFDQLQRLKLSSNQLKTFDDRSTTTTKFNALISIDLQRNRFSTIPKIIAPKLVDLDLSSNEIVRITPNDLVDYRQLKNIGLTANPLICDCQLRWIRRWLNETYDRDLIRFIQWTCDRPLNLRGKQLTSIDENEMSCSSPLNSSSLIIIKNLQLNSNGRLFVSWDLSNEFPTETTTAFYQIEIFDPNARQILFQRSYAIDERSMEIDVRKHLHSFPLTYLICLRIHHDRSCRNVDYQRTPLASSSSSSDRYLHFLLGAFLGAAFICFALILVCFIRESTLRSNFVYSRQCSLDGASSSTTTDPYHIYQQITTLNSCPHHQRLRTEPIFL